MLELTKIPRLQNKFECWKHVVNFGTFVDQIIPALTHTYKASIHIQPQMIIFALFDSCIQVVSSRKFANLLQFVLTLENHLQLGGEVRHTYLH